MGRGFFLGFVKNWARPPIEHHTLNERQSNAEVKPCRFRHPDLSRKRRSIIRNKTVPASYSYPSVFLCRRERHLQLMNLIFSSQGLCLLKKSQICSLLYCASQCEVRESDSALKKRGKEAFTALTAIVYPLPTMMAEIWA